MRLPAAALVLLLLLYGCAHPARERYQPRMLAAEARQARAEGRLQDAHVLLARAALLAPHDTEIALELQRVRAELLGAGAPAAPQPATAARPAPPPATSPSSLPGPWPRPPTGP